MLWVLMTSLEGAGYNDVDTEHFDWIAVICLHLGSGLLPTINTFQVYRDQASGRVWNHEKSGREARITYNSCFHQAWYVPPPTRIYSS
jgi:hypothetical protein